MVVEVVVVVGVVCRAVVGLTDVVALVGVNFITFFLAILYFFLTAFFFQGGVVAGVVAGVVVTGGDVVGLNLLKLLGKKLLKGSKRLGNLCVD